jgi:hypothetical protein
VTAAPFAVRILHCSKVADMSSLTLLMRFSGRGFGLLNTELSLLAPVIGGRCKLGPAAENYDYIEADSLQAFRELFGHVDGGHGLATGSGYGRCIDPVGKTEVPFVFGHVLRCWVICGQIFSMVWCV